MIRIIFICILLCTTAWACDDAILLGIVEDVTGSHYGDGHNMKVRALFSYHRNHWQAFKSDCRSQECLESITSSYPKEVTWYIGFGGRRVGKVTASTPHIFKLYSEIGIQDITDGVVPIIGKPSLEFSGFRHELVYRPLIALSKPNFQDPKNWKIYRPTPALIKQSLQLIHKIAPPICKVGPGEIDQYISYQYGERDLDIRAHKSNDGSILLNVSIRGAFYCKGGDGAGGYERQMFAIGSDGTTSYLGPGLMLVDAGDYDHDGSSELLMSLSGYDKGGYVLFSNTYIEEARFEYHFH